MLKSLRGVAGYRTSILLAILPALMASPNSALASRRMTVEQLQQIIVAGATVHRPDTVVAQQLSEATLSERLSYTTLQKMIDQGPGPKTGEILRILADQSAFLDLPASEVLPNATPDFATQKAIMGRAVTYVTRTLPTLPNFVATRVTEQYSDLPPVDPHADPAVAGGLYMLRTVNSPVAFRDGQESDDPKLLAAADKGSGHRDSKNGAGSGLVSWGEFGPILGLVLIDGAKGKLGWSRWEQWGSKTVAVFQFSVDRSVSHYVLQYWRDDAGNVIGSRYGAGITMMGSRNFHAPAKLVRQVTGYRGILAVDPETGTILKITIESDLAHDDDLRQAAMAVEYAPVKIGDTTYTCPTHSVTAFATMHQFQNTPTSPMETVRELQLNDVNFIGYRRFGSESTLLIGNAASNSGNPDAGDTTAVSFSPAAGFAPEPAQPSAPAAEVASAAPPAAAPATKPAPEEPQEMMVSAAEGLPGVTGDTANAPTSTQKQFTLQVTTRLVDLALIATDKHNKPILNLKPEEVEIYDNGRKQQVAAFHHFDPSAPDTIAKPEQPSTPSNTFTNATPAVHTVQYAPDLLILLLDESHLPFNDLNRARGEVERFLKATRPDSRIALYSIGEHGFRVIQDVTIDHAAVEAKLAVWMPSASGLAQAAELDTRNNQQFDTVHNPQDLNSVNGNYIETPDSITTIDPQLRQMGDNPLVMVLGSMMAIARHFAAVPGHKSLAWISGDSVLLNWDDRAVGMEKSVNDISAVINHTKEALNEAHISLYAVDASIQHVGGAAVDPSLANANIELNSTATANSAPGGFQGPRNTIDGRATAQMQVDTRGIQGPVRELAQDTGGRAFNKGSDLKATLDGIEQESTALYEIAFNPDSQADNKIHTLTVTVPGRKDIKLRYRSSYLYNEEATSAKDRFQQVVWSPQDVTGINLTAEAVSAADSPTGSSAIKLRIAFPGLDLEQKDGRWADNLYIFVAQRDDTTQKAQVSGDTLRLSLKQATYDTGMPAGIPYQRAVDVKSKLSSVRVIVVDGNSGKMGSVTLPSSALHP